MILIAFSISCPATAQQDPTYIYLNKNGIRLTKKDSADIIRAISKPSGDEKLFLVHDRYLNGKDRMISHATNADGSMLQGYTIEFYPDGKKKSDEFFVDDNLSGPIKMYYPNGRLYVTGNFISKGFLLPDQYRDTSGHILATDGNGEALEFNDEFTNITARGQIEKGIKKGVWAYFKGNDLWYTITYIRGQFANGIGYDNVGKEYPFTRPQEPAILKSRYFDISDLIKDKARYNKVAKAAGIRGTVHMRFSVEKDGSVTDIEVLEGLGYGLDEEAIRVIKLTGDMGWFPAKQFGLPIKVTYEIPVNFGIKTYNTSFKPNSKF